MGASAPADRVGPAGRDAVRAFFQHRLDDDDLQPRKISDKLRLIVAGVCSCVVYAAALALLGLGGSSLMCALVALVAGLFFGTSIEERRIARELEQRCAAKVTNHAEFHRLLRLTRAAQAEAIGHAWRRVVSRTRIDRAQLRDFGRRSLFAEERALFDEAKLERKIGNLIDKSMRTISMGDAFCPEISPVSRRVRGPGGEPGRLYFNPLRLVALLVTETELVSCVVQLDLIGGNRHEEIRRIELQKVVDVKLEDTRESVPTSAQSLTQLGEQLGYAASERDEWLGCDLREARTTTRLIVTSTDGGSLTVPIRADVQLVLSSSALDHERGLSSDELEIDELVHTLNRLLRGQAPSIGPRVRTVSSPVKRPRLNLS